MRANDWMSRNPPVAFVFVALSLGMAWANSSQASDRRAEIQLKIPNGYESMARAGYPVDTILAIDRMHGQRRALALRIQALSLAKGQLLKLGYREPFFAWWPWTPPEGHPAGSLWLLSRYIKETWEMRQKQFDELSESLSHSGHSLRELNEASARVDDVLNAEASIHGKIIQEELALKEKYRKLASQIGARPPWDMLNEKSISEAVAAKR